MIAIQLKGSGFPLDLIIHIGTVHVVGVRMYDTIRFLLERKDGNGVLNDEMQRLYNKGIGMTLNCGIGKWVGSVAPSD